MDMDFYERYGYPNASYLHYDEFMDAYGAEFVERSYTIQALYNRVYDIDVDDDTLAYIEELVYSVSDDALSMCSDGYEAEELFERMDEIIEELKECGL